MSICIINETVNTVKLPILSGQNILNVYLHLHGSLPSTLSLPPFLGRSDGLEVSLQSPDSSLSDQLLQSGVNLRIGLLLEVKAEASLLIVNHHVTTRNWLPS